LNKINFNYSYSQEYSRTPVYENRFNWAWNLDVNYTNALPDILAFTPTKFLKDVPLIGVYSDWKLNLLPSNIGFGLNVTRGRQTEQSRFLSFASPVVRNFFADRKANFTWKLSQGGFLSPNFDYSFNTRSSLIDLEFDEFGNQRTGSQISNAMFNNGIDFGRNTTHTQNLTINFKPIFPVGFMAKYLDMNGSYNVNYMWNDPLMPDPAVRDRAKNTSYNGQFRFNMNFGLRSFGDEIFGITPANTFGRRPDQNGKVSLPLGKQVLLGIKSIFLDYDKINISVNQTNNSTNPGVYGGTGMSNFWGRGITGRQSLDMFGPSFAYQLGLVSNPHGGFRFNPSGSFPFMSFDTYAGLRPANGRYQDNYRQSTDLNISTNRPLWEGATLDLTWRTTKAYNRNQTVITDVNGVPTFTNVIAMETIDRTFISMPKVFGMNLFGNTIEDVVKEYELQRDAIIARTDVDTLEKNKLLNKALAQAFYTELETFSLSGVGEVAKFLPSINWGIRWTGIEKWDIWDGYLKKVQVDHNYTSNYSEAVQITDNGRVIQNQQVTTGFSPLVGVNVSFDETKVDGTLTGSIRWNRTQGYNLNAAAKSVVTSQTTDEIAVQASYTMNSFSIPFLGFQLKNELEFSFLGSYKFNGRGTFDVFDPASFEGGQEEGRVLDGSTVISIEPRVRYSLSERLTASFFVRYDGTFNVGAANPGFHTTQVGLDFRLSIAGGR
jgi:cell surface protein SprA